MRIVRKKDRVSFNPPGSKVDVTILTGKGSAYGDFKNHTVAIVNIPPGEQLDEHFHNEREESYLILEGKGVAIISGKQIELEPGDTVTVSPGEKHLLKSSPESFLRYFVITAPAWILEDVHRS